jgi:dsRNA-specific ribonuclease
MNSTPGNFFVADKMSTFTPDVYFPTHNNGVDNIIIDGYNYDAESLIASPIATTAISIRERIIAIHNANPVVITDLSAGLGTLEAVLSKSAAIVKVLAYIDTPRQFEYFNRNIQIFGVPSKVIARLETYSSSTFLPMGSVVILNTLPGGKFLGFNVEMCLPAFTTTYLVVAIVPLATTLTPVTGWNYELKDFVDCRVYYCTNPTAGPTVLEHRFGISALTAQPLPTVDQWVDPTPRPRAPVPVPIAASMPIAAVGAALPTSTTSALQSDFTVVPTSPPRLPVVNATASSAPITPSRGFILPAVSTKTRVKPSTPTPGPTPGPASGTTGPGLGAPGPTPGPTPGPRLIPGTTPVTPKTVTATTTPYQQFIATLPERKPSAGSPEEQTRAWYTQLQAFLYLTLSAIVADPEILRRLVDAQAMPTWARAFTHETYSRVDNYETLETIGDGVLEYIFRRLIYTRLPTLTSAQMTNYKSSYMSKKFQAHVAQELGLTQWVRIRMTTTISVAEDLFEAFFGALDHVGDLIEPGKGSVLCLAFLTFLFTDVKFETKFGENNPRTFVDQTADRLFLGLPGKLTGAVQQVVTNLDGTTTVSISFTEQGIATLKAIGIQVQNPLGVATGSTKRVATSEAYERAFETLSSAGLTLSVVNHQRALYDLEELSKLDSNAVQLARQRAVTQYGTDDLRFVNVKSSNTIQLIVVLTSGEEQILAQVVQPSQMLTNEMITQLRLKLVQSYAKQ